MVERKCLASLSRPPFRGGWWISHASPGARQVRRGQTYSARPDRAQWPTGEDTATIELPLEPGREDLAIRGGGPAPLTGRGARVLGGESGTHFPTELL